MAFKQKIKVLVIDDSLVFRETLARGISKDAGIEVVGTASDPFMARDMIIQYEPEVLTLDVEMPKMSGIDFLKKLMPQYPLPVVVVSAVSSNVFDALNSGAVDFVTKPEPGRPGGMESFINELIIKIKIASTAKVGKLKNVKVASADAGRGDLGGGCHLIAIGASTGGTEATLSVISRFPAHMPPVLIVQHMPPVFTKMYADRLNNICDMEVKEAEHGDEIIQGRILIAPGDAHMIVKKGNTMYVECKKSERVNGHCPSVDVLFNSLADLPSLNCIGVILTGMGYDGAKGLLRMKKNGSLTIGQDEESSIVYGMPKVAWDIGAVSRQLPLLSISDAIFTAIQGIKKKTGV